MSNFLHDIPRHFKEAYHGLLRNIAMTLSSVSAVTVTLVLIAVFTVFAMNISAFTKNMESDTKIHVQIEDVIEESKIPSLQEAVEKIANVSEVTYSDKDAELDAFIEIYGEHGELFESYRGEANPLKRAFIVEVDDGDEIERVTQDITKIPGIESALYGGTNVLAMMDAFNAIRSDLGECQWMDSTFMGILAMLALRAKKTGAEISVHNAGPQNTELLYGLGLKKLFQFVDAGMDAVNGANTPAVSAAPGDSSNPASYAHTVLEAHETLMDVDEGNVKKFDKVVSLVKQDLERKK